MPDGAGFDPSREWLGIDAIDLGDPFRALGLAADASDPAVVSAAAERLLEKLRGTQPGAFTVAHEALTRRVEACRDEALTILSARRTNVVPPPPPPAVSAPPPPVPPPLAPPPVPGSSACGPADAPPAAGRADEDDGIPPRRPSRGRLSHGRPGAADPLPAVLSLLAVVVAGVAASVAWPRLAGTRKTRPPVVTAPRAVPPPPVASARKPEVHPAAGRPVAVLSGTRRTPPQQRPSDDERRSRPTERPAETAAPAQSPPAPPAPPDPRAAARTAAAAESAIRQAYQAIRDGGFALADAKLQEADRLADEDRLVDRITCWRQFARYAREFAAYRERALNDANAGGDYDVRWEDGRRTRIAVIESTPQKFAFKAAGRIERIPRDRIPEPIVTAIVQAWFAAADRPGNHVFLGVHLLARRTPDPDAAAREWTLAKQGGEDVSNLEPILRDPIIVKAAAGR